MSVVVVLSAFNLYTHSARIKSSLGVDATVTSTPSASEVDAPALQTAIEMGPPGPATVVSETPVTATRISLKEKKRAGPSNAAGSRAAKGAPAATAALPCEDVAAVLGLCTRDKAAAN